jgi:hypothetical protein
VIAAGREPVDCERFVDELLGETAYGFPPWTNHVFVGTGEEPSAILMIGHRPTDHRLLYPVSQAAAKYDASVKEETTRPSEASGELPVFGQPCHPVWPL